MNPPTMLAIEASVSLAKSKKFSTHVEEPAFGTLYRIVNTMGGALGVVLIERVKNTLHQARLWVGEW